MYLLMMHDKGVTVVYSGVINLFRALCSYRDKSLRRVGQIYTFTSDRCGGNA